MRYKFYGKRSVTWFSDKTGRSMKPRQLQISQYVEANSLHEAMENFKGLMEAAVTTDQKRIVSFSGYVFELDGSRIIGRHPVGI